MVWPTGMAGTPSTWPQATSGTAHKWYFSGNGVSSGAINVTDATKGVGDPCTYYLGGTWRLPINIECIAMCNNVANGSDWNQAGGSWGTSPVIGGTFNISSNQLFFPASGNRYNTNSSFYSVTSLGFGWSSSINSATTGFGFYFNSSEVYPRFTNLRSYAFPVRCVSN